MGIVSTYLRAFNTKRVDPYPVEILKRVDQPTTVVREGEVGRVDERESGFNRALRGDFGQQLTKPKTENKWWLDLEEVNGKITIPSQAGHRGNHRPLKR